MILIEDYPDYELPSRTGWPPPQESFPSSSSSSLYSDRRPVSRPLVEQPLAAAPLDEYRPAAAPNGEEILIHS